MIPKGFFDLNSEGQCKAIMDFDIDQLSHLDSCKDIQFKKVKLRVTERLRKLKRIAAKEKEYQRKGDILIKMLEEGWVKKYAVRELGLDRRVAERLIQESGYNYVPTNSMHIIKSKPESKRKDRLHYHKWDSSLVLKSEFFERIEEFS